MKIGVFLARMQPLHNGHLEVLRIAERTNDKVIVLIGSNDKSGTPRNPLPGNKRKEILEKTLAVEFGEDLSKKFEIHLLDDWSYEDDLDGRNEWGKYLYYNIVARAGVRNDFKLYFSDDPHIMLSWFDNDFRDRINFTFLEREYIENGISATKIRKALLDNNIEFVKKHVPETVLTHVSTIQDVLKEIHSEDENNSK